MNLFIVGKTIHVKLSPLEIRLFKKNGKLEAKIPLEEGIMMKYSLEKRDQGKMELAYGMNELRIFIPDHVVTKWLYNHVDHLEYFVQVDRFNYIKISIEKATQESERPFSQSQLENYIERLN